MQLINILYNTDHIKYFSVKKKSNFIYWVLEIE